MTTLLLIRHGETDAVGQSIMGWLPGWHLNPAGRRQAALLAQRLACLPIQAVYSSPLERAMETAEPIASPRRLEVSPREDLGELRMGDWEGQAISELDTQEHWRRFNAYRSCVRAPGGELMIEAQTRMVRELDQLRARHPEGTIAIVSHGDPLRAALAHFLAIPLDLMLRFEISPASVSVVEASDWAPRILCVNSTGDLAS